MSPSRQQTIHNETTKENYDNMDGEQQKNLSTPRSSTTYTTNASGSHITTMTFQEQQKGQEHQQQLDKEVTTTDAQQQQQEEEVVGNYYNFEVNALVQNALAQAKIDPEVVEAAAHLFILANQARNNGYYVDANSNVVDVTATNRSSAMSLSNLLLPDETNSSSKAT
ncbi:hypothetical protein C1645_878413 [Glomus cerebriforme]|uniref:Uncharacterized protein n=1 Tax=Glomus cerebriforme TaxID=658196 RepID=A0A397SVC4_9GLOM|nr:hypothetical protein C1645_878413 [Glomus cerebriforme]